MRNLSFFSIHIPKTTDTSDVKGPGFLAAGTDPCCFSKQKARPKRTGCMLYFVFIGLREYHTPESSCLKRTGLFPVNPFEAIRGLQMEISIQVP